MQIFDARDVERILDFPTLIEAIREAFATPAEGTGSFRTLYKLDAASGSPDAFAVLPAWNREVIGVKAFTYLPSNAERGVPILHSKILLFSRADGTPVALVDGTTVTYWRTAAVAGLASDYLSRKDSRSLVLLGTGNLAPYMARAHLAVRPLTRVGIWGRNPAKAEAVVADLRKTHPEIEVRVVSDLEGAVREADIVSAATGSPDPLVLGSWVRPGTHTDFFGNHEVHARECDTDLVEKSRVYVDGRTSVMREAGELLIPIAEGRFSEDRILGELADLASGRVPGRRSEEEITLFKSVGSAVGDLAGAHLVARSRVRGAE